MMRWLEKIRIRSQMLFHRRRESQRLDTELAFHLEQQIAENVARGMSSEEAGYAARRAFGNTMLLREQARDTWSWTTLELLLQNLRISMRTLARAPAFAFVSILVIAIGIGANLALFTVVRSVLMKPLPFEDPKRLVRLYEHSADDKFPYNEVAGGIFTEWKKQSHGFSDLAIVLSWPQYNLSGTRGQLPERVRAAFCSWNLLPALGVEPALGRGFTAADDQPSANATAILSWGMWKRRFGGDPTILNQTIHLDGKPYTVIGIMPSWFAYPEQSVQLWTPVYHEQFPDRWEQLDAHMFVVIGRLKPGMTAAEATSELSLIVRRLHEQHLDNPFISKAAQSRPLLDDLVRDVKTPLYVLSLVLAAVGLFGVLSYIIAQRTSEIGIRIALGAQRENVLKLVLLDGLRPAFFGLAFGIAGGIAAAQLIRSMLYGTGPLDPAVFLTVTAILLLVAAAACLIPAWRASRLDPMVALRTE
jgi:hypothetical protein